MLKNDIYLSNGVAMPNIMIGSFQVENQSIMTDMVATAIEEECYGFDTSPSYGTEQMLGEAIYKVLKEKKVKREDIFVADKIDGWQMYKSKGEITKYVEKSLKDLKLEYLDLLLIHWPFDNYLKQTWRSMERLYQKGILRSIGLSNVNIKKYEQFLKGNPKIEPHVVQNEIHPLNTCNNDVLYFQRRNIVVEAYSPLCRMVPEIKNSDVLKGMEHKYKKSIPQILLRWNLQRGIVPIFTSKNKQRIKDNLSLFDFTIDENDFNSIMEMNIQYKIFPESYGCPGY